MMSYIYFFYFVHFFICLWNVFSCRTLNFFIFYLQLNLSIHFCCCCCYYWLPVFVSYWIVFTHSGILKQNTKENNSCLCLEFLQYLGFEMRLLTCNFSGLLSIVFQDYLGSFCHHSYSFILLCCCCYFLIFGGKQNGHVHVQSPHTVQAPFQTNMS